MSKESQPNETDEQYSFEAAARRAGYPTWLSWWAAKPEAANAAVEIAREGVDSPTAKSKTPFRDRQFKQSPRIPFDTPLNLSQHIAKTVQEQAETEQPSQVERLTFKVNQLLDDKEWEHLNSGTMIRQFKVGQHLKDGSLVFVSQSFRQSGEVASLVQRMTTSTNRSPHNDAVQWTLEGGEIDRLTPDSVTALEEVLDELLEKKDV